MNPPPQRLTAVRPHLPFMYRTLLIYAFIDSASQTLLDYDHHARYLASAHGLPRAAALFLIAASTMTSFLACTMLFLQPLQRRAVHLLLLSLLYHHLVYTLSSSSSSSSYIIRDLCLVVTLLLLVNTNSDTSIPLAVDEQHALTTQRARNHALAFVARLVFALFACQMALSSHVASPAIWIIAPVALVYLLGFLTHVISIFLVAFYTLVTFSQYKFWLVDPSAHAHAAFERHALRFDFARNVSVISGLLVLFSMAPAAHLSFDSRLVYYLRYHSQPNNNNKNVSSNSINLYMS